jgi:hypothetical protein
MLILVYFNALRSILDLFSKLRKCAADACKLNSEMCPSGGQIKCQRRGRGIEILVCLFNIILK